MKKILSGILASTLILSTMSASFAVETPVENLVPVATATLNSGVCGENATYTYDETTKTLTISGTGKLEVEPVMEEFPGGTYARYYYPWENYTTLVQALVVEEGITDIGSLAFAALSIKTAVLPDSLEVLRDSAFHGCDFLYSISGGYSISHLGTSAFGSTNLVEYALPANMTVLNGNMFQSCSLLERVFVPETVTEIGEMVFENDVLVNNGTDWEYVRQVIDKVVVYGFAGSAIETYCLERNVPFEAVSQVPTWAYTTASFPGWAETYINFVKDDYMSDITPYNCGENSIRGVIAQALYKMSDAGFSFSRPGTTGFTDMGNYSSAIAWCNTNGVMNGVEETLFGTESPVTRQQFALILQKASSVLNKTAVTADVDVLSAYTDVGLISDWAKEGMAWAVANNLMAGNDGVLNPLGNITRTEVAVMLYNFDQL